MREGMWTACANRLLLTNAARCGGVAGKIGGGLGAPSDFELGQDARDVVLHGFFRQAELVADLLVRPPLRNEREDPLLLRGEASKPLVLHQMLALTESVEDRTRDGRIQQALPGSH